MAVSGFVAINLLMNQRYHSLSDGNVLYDDYSETVQKFWFPVKKKNYCLFESTWNLLGHH